MVGHVTPYKIKKECYDLSCLVGARRTLLFMAGEGIPADGGGLVNG